MNKKIIAGVGIAAFGLGVLPTAGAFAATSVTDEVSLTVESSCMIGSTKTVAVGSINPGGTGTKNDTITINCNDSTGWNIKAQGSQTGTATSMTGSNGGSIATGTSGSAFWNFKFSTSSDRIQIQSGYTAAAAIPSAATKIANSASEKATISSGELVVTYTVKASASQLAGTYTGKVTYTISSGTS